MMGKLTVLIADDNAEERLTLVDCIKGTNIDIVAEAEDGEGALEAARKYRPDICMFDMLMPVMTGAEVAAQIRMDRIDTQVIIITGFVRKDFLIQSLDAGVRIYLHKPCRVGDIRQAISSALKGEVLIAPDALKWVVEDYLGMKMAQSSGGVLNENECRLLKCIADGMANKEIGNVLHISEKAVEKQIAKLASRFGVHSRINLLMYVIKKKLFMP
jgi:NarL family two-component system response regulator LiaR